MATSSPCTSSTARNGNPLPITSLAALARVEQSFANEARYFEALRVAGLSIAEIAERLDTARLEPAGAVNELTEVAKDILAAMRLSIPEDDEDPDPPV